MSGPIVAAYPAAPAIFPSGGSSAFHGFFPVPLTRVPLAALRDIPVYLRTVTTSDKDAYTLFSGPSIPFAEKHRTRLAGAGVSFVYLPIARQSQFRQQTEDALLDVANDPAVAASVRSEIVYETSVQLVDELLADPNLASKSARLDEISRSVARLVLSDRNAFSHLFTASHHDFYTATHMVNVATWMVPLAYTLGHTDPEQLSQICQAGLLHDVGKLFVSRKTLNAKGRLSHAQLTEIRRHPQLGYDHLSTFPHIPDMIRRVALEHHERSDGTGYPNRLTATQLHPVSRICAVVDSFDAMTAFRPFKQRTMSVADAMDVITRETPRKYDPEVVEAWVSLMRSAQSAFDTDQKDPTGNRRFERFRIHVPAVMHALERGAAFSWLEGPPIKAIAHNTSRTGLGLLGQTPVTPGQRLRVHLHRPGTLAGTREGIATRCRPQPDGWFEIGLHTGNVNPTPVPLNATPA